LGGKHLGENKVSKELIDNKLGKEKKEEIERGKRVRYNGNF